MKKHVCYQPPRLEIVALPVENGFAASPVTEVEQVQVEGEEISW